MRKTRVIAVELVLGTFLIMACSTSDKHPPLSGSSTTTVGTGGSAEGGATSIPANTTEYELEVGATIDVKAGTQVGYFLTASATRDYSLRWTGDSNVSTNGYHEFYGSVFTTRHFTNVTPGVCPASCPLEGNETVSQPIAVTGGERIDWLTDASTGFDGFSVSTDADPIYLDVSIDGAKHPEITYFVSTSGALTSPAASPFSITSESEAGVSEAGSQEGGTDAGSD